LKWIQKIFPNESSDETDQNILLQTIRVPKNLMSLTDKLPKPYYEEDHKRNTSDFFKIAKEGAKAKNKRMNKIEEADEDKEKEIKVNKRKINIHRIMGGDVVLPEVATQNDSLMDLQSKSPIPKQKRRFKPRNISMDQVDNKKEDLILNIKSISPVVANMLMRKYKHDKAKRGLA